jgi:uncharacterized protein (DUF1778 family)
MSQQTTTRTARESRFTRERTEIEVILSREAQEKFVDLLLNPPEPGRALKRAFQRHRALVAE